MAVPSEHPVSPWAERLNDGSMELKTRNGVRHSCFAPEYPPIPDPKKWLEIPPPPTPPPPPPPMTPEQRLLRQIQGLDRQQQQPQLRQFTPQTNEDLDRVFYDEEIQMFCNFGLRTWECASLSATVWYDVAGQVSGGQLANSAEGRDVDVRTRIKVDETRWLPFLRKDKWYDWIQTSPPAPPGQEGKVWSIDDPEVWEAIKTPLELVDRMFKALIRDKHDFAYWSKAVPPVFNAPEPFPSARLLLGRNMDQMLTRAGGDPTPLDWNLISQFDENYWTTRLNYLLDRHLMSFTILDGIDAHACDINQEVFAFSSICHINTARVVVLMDKELTLSERAFLELQLAITILHEFMHAIYVGRKRLDKEPEGNCVDLNDPLRARGDPIHDCFGIGELGLTMEDLVFGGVCDVRPTGNGIPIAITALRTPNRTSRHYDSVPGNWPTAPLHLHHVSALWATKLFSEAFWRDPSIPRKSDNFFHKSAVFECTEKDELGTGFKEEVVHDLKTLKYAYLEDHLTVGLWYTRQQLWAGYRVNWFYQEQEEWRRSPWFLWNYRIKMDKFADAFKRKDEMACAEIAQWVIEILPWERSWNEYVAQFPTQTDANPRWVFHVIGLLMSASIPTRVKKYSVKATNQPPWTFIGFPSKSADAAGENARINIGGLVYVREVEKEALETNYYNQFRAKAVDRTEAYKVEQNDFLDLAQDVLNYVSTRSLVYHTWGREITKVFNRLLGERARIRHDYPNSHQQHWAKEWRFDVPAYEKGTVLWDGNTYQDMALNTQTGQWQWVRGPGRRNLQFDEQTLLL